MSNHAAKKALERSLAALTVGEPQAHLDRERELYPLRATDMAQNVLATFGGEIGRNPLWTRIAVAFPCPFIMAMDPGRTDSNVPHPHFATGVETKQPISVSINLTDWVGDDRGFITGAKFMLGVWAPSNRKRLKFSGKIHLTFFGYAAPEDDDSEG
jgi:hypothetical protein